MRPRAAAKPAAAASRPAAPALPAFVRNWIFGGNTIVKVGVLILFLGLAFLLRYAADRVTVPLPLRYAGVALLGALLLAVGWRLRKRADASGGTGYGLILQGAGVGIFYLTTLAALKISQLLPPEVAFAFLFGVSLFGAVLAVAQDAPWLAYVAAAEGFAAPALVSTGGGNHIALFSYLAVLNVGVALMAWFKAWRPLNLLAFISTFMLATAWAQKHYDSRIYFSTQAFLIYFVVLFSIVSVLFARRALALGAEPDASQSLSRRAAQAWARVGRVDSSLTFGVPLVGYGLQYPLVRDWAFGPAWAALLFGLFHLLLGAALLRGARARYALLGEAYVIVSVIFGTLAVPLALEGSWTGATWAIEAAGMYWLGVRQRRPYARAFALLVLAGAALRLAITLRADLSPGTPLLAGSVLGMLMLAAGSMAIFLVARRNRTDDRERWEAAGQVGALWIALAALACAAWIVWTPAWASVATSVIATACSLAQARAPLPALQAAIAVLHGLALVGLASTVRIAHGSAMLASGWRGLVAALLVGGGLLFSAWLAVSVAARDARKAQQDVRWSIGTSVGLLAAVAVLSASLLFILPADQAARVWPWMGVVALWLGLRVAHPALLGAWAVLQVASAVAFLAYGPALWSAADGLTLWTPLVLTLAGLVSGDALQRQAPKGSALPSLAGAEAQWVVVGWALAWWSQTLLPDLDRWLLAAGPDWQSAWPAVLAGWLILTSLAVGVVARWRRWQVLGQGAWITTPAMVLPAWLAIGAPSGAPHQHLGWLAWPLALACHVYSLLGLKRWWSEQALVPLHVIGCWLFLVLAAKEAQWWTSGWGAPGSAWSVLGWVLVPAVVLVALVRLNARRRWPVASHPDAYLVVACAPIALYLLAWLWRSNLSDGSARPLPYVPLLNPLEIGHGIVLLALAVWPRALPGSATKVLTPQLTAAVLGVTAFALYTGIVLRSCHHWADVDWSERALFASTLTQAALSLAWSVAGVALMMLAHRRAQREVWMVGAALLAVVVVKLFFVELADRGGLYRVMSFIAVGLLLLLVGFFAPVPPRREEKRDAV